MRDATGRMRGHGARSVRLPFVVALACVSWACLAVGCGGGGGGEGAVEGGGGEGAASTGAEQTPDRYADTRAKLVGQWRERLPEQEARELELMQMAIDHPDWRRRDIARQDLPPEDETNLESFLNIMRIDPEAKDRLRKAVDNAGMRARFTEETVALGRDDMEDVEIPYEIVAVHGDTVELLLEAEGEEPTEITFIDDTTFEAPWGGGGETITFDKQG